MANRRHGPTRMALGCTGSPTNRRRTGYSSDMTNTLLTLHDPAAAARYYAEGLWRNETLYGLLEKHAAERPNDFGLRDGQRRLSWRELREAADAIAADLHRAGLKRGERVSMW